MEILLQNSFHLQIEHFFLDCVTPGADSDAVLHPDGGISTRTHCRLWLRFLRNLLRLCWNDISFHKLKRDRIADASGQTPSQSAQT